MDPLGGGQKHRTSVAMMRAAIERGRSAWHCQTSELSLVRGRLRAAVRPVDFEDGFLASRRNGRMARCSSRCPTRCRRATNASSSSSSSLAAGRSANSYAGRPARTSAPTWPRAARSTPRTSTRTTC
ncbi:hypothetical protein [Streptomyces phaeoluteigriseus]